MGDLIIKPASSGSLKIQDQAGTDFITTGTSSGLTLDSGVTFPSGMIINTTYGTYSTQTQLSSTNTYVDAISVTVTRKQSSSTMMVRGVLPVYWYT